MTLWHYTCAHGHEGIAASGGVLMPNVHVYIPLALVWASDLPEPDVEGLGLTRTLLACDRTEFRYRITDEAGFVPWREWWPHRVAPRLASALTFPPKRPAHWWVSEQRAPAVLS